MSAAAAAPLPDDVVKRFDPHVQHMMAAMRDYTVQPRMGASDLVGPVARTRSAPGSHGHVAD